MLVGICAGGPEAAPVPTATDESRLAEQRVDLGHPFADRDFLRTTFFTVVAGKANPGPGCLRDKNLILEARPGDVFVEKRFVVDLKIGRDVQSVWAGHAVVALGAGNNGSFQVLLLQVCNHFQVRRLK
jgi:hypothetical protein